MPIVDSRILGMSFVVAGAAVAAGQAPNRSEGGPQLAPPLFSGLTWRNIGPTAMGGRIDRVAVARVRGQPDQIYIAASSGGAFKSTNGGVSWNPVFDAVNGAKSMGDVAVAPSNPNIVWIGTGEETTVAYYWGDGVYKSTDAGRTWTNMGLKDIRHTGRIAIHPTNPDIVLVAAQGRLWGPSSERGIFNTEDGGRTWRKVLFVDENTGANEVLFDPTNPQNLYAASYQRQRKSYGGITVGPASGIYKSVDGGNTWTKATRGLPTAELGRIGLSVSPIDPNIVYADIEVSGARYPAPQGSDGDCPPPGSSGRGINAFESQGGVYRSMDRGETWEQVNPRLDQPAGYFAQIRADPKDRNRVYRLGLQFYVSDDMGKTFRTVQARLHADYHDLWIDPDDNNHLIVANDGGLGISWDRGNTWDYRDNIPISQYWEMSVDTRDPYLICGGTQDNGNWCVPSASRNRNGISNRDVFSVGGGDGMWFAIDPRDTNYAFIETNSVTTTSSIQRLNLSSLQRQSAKPMVGRPINCYDAETVWARGGRGLGRGVGDDPAYRWGWDAPIVFSSVTPGVVYVGANALFKSTDRGGTWKQISGDLSSRVNRDTVFIMGKAVGTVNYSPGGGPSTNPLSVPLFGQITFISESGADGRVLAVGTDDGQVQVTRNGGATWTNVTKNIPGLPPHTFVSSVVASRHAAGRLYATFDGHFNNDENTYVYSSDDYGQTWRKITNGLPATSVNRLAEDPRTPHVLVVSHAYGIHFSNDAGANWHSLSTNMPTVPVRSIVFHARDNALVAGSYGRGIWVLDDVSPLQKLTPDGVRADAMLVSVTRGRQWSTFPLGTTFGVGVFYAPNPELNPVITYYLRGAANGGASISIKDATGRTVRTMQGPVTAGLNRVVWDMRMDPVIEGPAPQGRGGGRGGGGGGGGGGGRGGGAGDDAGPLVQPGEYSATITIPGIARPLTGRFAVTEDSRERMTPADREARQSVIMSLYGLQKTLLTARGASRALLQQADGIKQDLARGGVQVDSVLKRIAQTDAELDRLMSLAGSIARNIESLNAAPLGDQRQQAAWAFADASRAIAMLNRTSQTDLPALYSQHGGGARPRTVGRVALPTNAITTTRSP
jgi:photosystem II stability/assembly factor-like uncharacterized protein